MKLLTIEPAVSREVKSQFGGTEEMVDNFDQDGYGVGLLRKVPCSG